MRTKGDGRTAVSFIPTLFLPMITDFRLKVFEAVARRLSFTKAAEELFITQPAVTRHIREIELQLNQQLFRRNGRKIELTGTGNHLLAHVRHILKEYDLLNESMTAGEESVYDGHLVIGASTTVSQYVIPPILALFNKSHPNVSIKLVNGNSDAIEELIANETVHLGIIEGIAHHPDLHYKPFLQDEIILVSAKPHVAGHGSIKLKDIHKLPLLRREDGSGTRKIVAEALKNEGILAADLHTPIILGNTESIKSYLLHSDACAFLSSSSIKPELARRELFPIPIRDFRITRTLQFALVHGVQRKLSEYFMRFCLAHHNNN